MKVGDIMDNNIGLKIKKIRKENKDTLKTLAEKIDYDWSNLSKVERGVYGASLELLKKITDVYKISPNYFFDGLTEAEGKVLTEEDLDLSKLKEKYKFENLEGGDPTEEELMAAIKLIRQLDLLKRSNHE
jgi:transcriptional regulator with XRE-family HTH domain